MIKRSLHDRRFTLIKTAHHPYWIESDERPKRRKHKALIGVGGNIGDVMRRFEHLHWFLRRTKEVTLLQSAPILRNPPFGYLEQPYFYNSLLLVSTSLTPRELLGFLLRAEKRFGRVRALKDGPRTLDLDIIFYDDLQMQSAELTIPHSEWMHRNSVLIPLKHMKGRR